MATQETSFVEKSIEINARAATVWRVFTDPVLTRQMGGEYVSNWNVGSSLRWKGPDGQLLTNGTILKIEPEKLLQHALADPTASSTRSVITYELRERGTRTTLVAREEFSAPLPDTEYADTLEGWDAALLSVKGVAEQHERS